MHPLGAHPAEDFSEKTAEAEQILFSRILVATDFSAISHRALQYALALARRYGSKIYVGHVIPERPLASPYSPLTGHGEAEQQMQEFTHAISGNGHSCTTLIEDGEGPLSLWVTIERLKNRYKIDLIVAGTAGTRGLGARSGTFLGSGAEQIFRHATCPVLTIGPTTQTCDAPEIAFENVLYVTDFGASAERALRYVVSVAREFDASVKFLHVVEDMEGFGPQTHEHLRQIHVQRMRHTLSASHAADIQADFRVRFGKVIDEILGASHELSADLIIMGAKATAGWAGHAPLSTAYNIAAKASCPVLTVRA